jgi:hypothetical protein
VISQIKDFIMEKKTHETHTTTLRVNAGYWPYSCGFFCQRFSTSDVIDPALSAKTKAEQPETTKTLVSG